jgi:hypothetical protein
MTVASTSRALTLLARCVAVILLVTAAAARARAQAVEELTAEQRATIDEGRDVFLTWDVPNSAWPRACVFQHIEATSEEAAAVFTNYERHLAFIPNLREATISRVIDPATVEVDYTLDVPIVADEHYTVRDRVSTYQGGTSYRIEWSLVRATSTKATEGSVRFEPHRSGTLMAYCNLVSPGGRLAGLGFIRSRAMTQVRDAARSIATEIERERTSDRALLDAELGALRTALRGHAGEVR